MAMIYVQRDPRGQITAVHQDELQGPPADADRWEAVAPDDPALRAFVASLGRGAGEASAHPLVGTDLAMARVLEDLINLLLDQSVIRFTDLPPGAQAKLLERQNTRAAISRLRLMGDADPENREII